MFFKRIEMHGFKSFAEPVTIEFELKDVFGVTKTVSVVVTAAK